MDGPRATLVGEAYRRAVGVEPPRVDEAVGALGPLEDHVRALLRLGREEEPIHVACLGLEYADHHLHAGLAQQADPATCHLRERVYAGHDDTWDARATDQVGAGRRLAVVRARLEGHVEG